MRSNGKTRHRTHKVVPAVVEYCEVMVRRRVF